MLGPTDILIALGGMLATIVALHAYAHWSIRNIDNNTKTQNRQEDGSRVLIGRTRPADLATVPVRTQDVPPRRR
jgi:hypothetical protein